MSQWERGMRVWGTVDRGFGRPCCADGLMSADVGRSRSNLRFIK